MRNITSYAKLLFAAVLCLCGISTYAQDAIQVDGISVPVVATQTVDVNEIEKVDYSGNTAVFDASAVRAALGVDSLSAAQQYIVNVTTNEAVENTTDGWRDANGDLATWGSSAGMVCVKINEADSDTIDYIGCIDATHVAGETYTAIWGFVANGKAALVKVVIHFVSNGAPGAETVLANLTIVGTAEVSSERYASQGYETSSVELVNDEIASKLGMDKDALSKYIANMTYVIGMNTEFGTQIDTLQLLSQTDGWLHQTFDENGDSLLELAAMKYDGSCYIFVQKMAYSNDSISFIIGQYPGNSKVGDKHYVNLYIVNENKAYVIKYTLNVIETPYIGFDGLTEKGCTEYRLEQYPTADYSAANINVDLDAIAAILGCSASEMTLRALDTNGGFSGQTTANNGGWWFDSEGYVHAYSGGAFFVEPAESGNYSVLHMGQMEKYYSAGDSLKVTLFLVYGESYYKLDITMNVIAKPDVNPDELTVVETRNITIQQLPSAAGQYIWSTGATIPYDQIIAAIGTSDPTLYGEETDETGATKYTDSYTCTPYPGFWLTNAGTVTTWGGSGDDASVWGISIAQESVSEGICFNAIQMPAVCNIGDVYSARFYLANPENNKMICVKVTYKIVETIEEFEEVGSTTFKAPLSNEETGIDFLDLTPIISALGIESEDALVEGKYLRAMKSTGAYSDLTTMGDGIAFDTYGYADEAGDLGIYFEDGQIFTWANTSVSLASGQHIDVTLCFENEGKRYIISLTLMNETDYQTGVTAIAASNGNSAIYDLAGRKVSKAQKGIYIQNGKKFIK